MLKGVVRVENIKSPEDHIPQVMERVRKEYIQRTYGIDAWEDHIDFLTQLAQKYGKLNKGGEPDLHTVSKMMLNDWLRGKIPYYVRPPVSAEEEAAVRAKLAEQMANAVAAGETAAVSAAKAKALRRPVPGVEQIFSKIRVDVNFMEDDVKVEVEDEEEDATATADAAASDDNEDVVEAEGQVDDEHAADNLDWDDVFESVVGETVTAMPRSSSSDANSSTAVDLSDVEFNESSVDSVDDSDASDSEEEDETADSKNAKRMTTNKRKVGVHYYATANVKNKNRNKKTTQKADPRRLEKKLKGDGKRRN